jgi:hypothetical protein
MDDMPLCPRVEMMPQTPLPRRLAILSGTILLALIGCKIPKGPPDDPLFHNRTPIEVKPAAGPPVHIMSTEPEMPSYPAVRKDAGPSPQRRVVDGQPILDQPKEPMPVEIIPPQ